MPKGNTESLDARPGDRAIVHQIARRMADKSGANRVAAPDAIHFALAKTLEKLEKVRKK